MKKLLPLLFLPLLLFSCSKKQAGNPENLPNTYANQALGSSAYDLLNATNYSSLSIQVQYMPGFALDTGALSNLQAYLESLCNKPGGVTITQSQITAYDTDTMNLYDVAVLEEQVRTAYNSSTNLAVHVLVTNGYDTAATVLGFAYRSTSVCLFGGCIFDHSGGMGQITRVSLESSVLEHEFGHLMGLVNLGTAMQTPHQETSEGYHCTNPNCLMYYALEFHTGYTPYNEIPKLDSNCLADLKANGGK